MPIAPKSPLSPRSVLAPLAGLALVLSLGLVSACATGRDDAGSDEATADAGTTPSPATQERQAAERDGFLTRLLRDVGESDEPNAGPCPTASVLYDAHRIVEFAGAEETYRNLSFTAEIRGVRGLCRYVGTDPITMDIEIDMAFGRGPAATTDTRDYRYWVVVTRRDIAPIAREVFSLPVTFPAGVDRLSGTERVGTITIPRASEQIAGGNFEVLVGFEVTPSQLEWNRQGKRFRIDAANAVAEGRLPGQ
jgi:hypothetical protein